LEGFEPSEKVGFMVDGPRKQVHKGLDKNGICLFLNWGIDSFHLIGSWIIARFQ
jgi:hypothetical protein